MSESGQESDAEYMYESSSDLGNEEDAMYEYEDESYPEPNDLGSNLMNENLVSTGKSVGYQILNYESVEKIMKSVVVNVGSVLDVDYQQAQLLLTSQRWDEEKLIESYFANPEELCKESGIDLYEKDVIQRRLDSRMNVSPFLCKICYDDASTEGFCLGCNHQFCISCYEGYLHNQVSEGPLCVMARCPEFKCTQAIPPIVYHTLLNSTEDKITYQRYALRQFIEANKSYRYCPAPNCECISVGSGETHVICTCGYQYCFHCTAEDHRPCSCTTLSKWVDKCNNDSETANWMAVNTKPCPKCISRIEKNQGCNHMTCRQCKHEFCWLCFGDWKGHTACNRYNADGKEVGEEENSIQKKKRDLERYMHYYKRYQNHEIAEKFAVKQRIKTELLLKTLQEQDCLVLQDAQCVREATEQVISCRRVLKYTYVIGYYMEDTAVNKQLFERHQVSVQGCIL